jgi:gluconolactonase
LYRRIVLALMGAARASIPLSRFRRLAQGLDHPEGVAWDPVSSSVYAGGEAGQIYRIELDGAWEQIAHTGGGPILGLTVDGHGIVYACDPGRHAVVRLDPYDPGISIHTSGEADREMAFPNFTCFDSAGNLYVTDSGTWHGKDGLIWKVTPDGSTSIWSDSAPRFTNGCCLESDESALLVVESTGRCITRLPITADGCAGPAGTAIELPGVVPDGVALTADGTIIVSCYRPDRLYVFADGAAEVLAEDPDAITLLAPTNVAFAGPGLDQLLVANFAGHHLSVADVDEPGLPLRRPAV